MRFFVTCLIPLILFSCTATPPDVAEEEKVVFYEVDEALVNKRLESMSLDDKLNELILAEIPDSFNLSQLPTYGGFLTNTLDQDFATQLSQRIDTTTEDAFFGLTNYRFAASLFQNEVELQSILANSDTLTKDYIHFSSVTKGYFGHNFNSYPIEIKDTIVNIFLDNQHKTMLIASETLKQSQKDSSIAMFGNYFLPKNDTTPLVENQLKGTQYLDTLLEMKLLSLSFNAASLNGKWGRNLLREELKTSKKFQGLIIMKDDTMSLFNQFWIGADLIQVTSKRLGQIAPFLSELKEKIEDKEIDITELENRLKKIITAKLWMKKRGERKTSFEEEFYVKAKHIQQSIARESFSLINNKSLPIKDVITSKPVLVYFDGFNYKSLYYNLSKYENVGRLKIKSDGSNLNLSKYNHYIIAVDRDLDSAMLNKIALLKSSKKLTIIDFRNKKNLSGLRFVDNLIMVYGNGDLIQEKLAQAIYGGIPFNGKLPMSFPLFRAHSGLKTKKIRLEYTIPEDGGIHRDSLKRLRAIANEMIWQKAAPGCQVLAIRDGKIICQKSFGHHTYAKRKMVTDNTVYDIASITKIASTTPAIMKMTESGKFNLDDSLRVHLPDSLQKMMRRPSNFANVTLRELLLHRSGAPAGLNILKYIQYRKKDSIGRWDKYFCNIKGNGFNTKLANSFWLDDDHQDSLWVMLNYTWLNPAKPYKYSDINMNMLYMLARSKLPKKATYRGYMNEQFYNPLGLRTMGYKPKLFLDTITYPIAPTENDRYWRGELLKGFVHDPTAALFGGVAGSAGIFCNAHDLGVFFEMLKQGGTYGGKRYLSSAIINTFTNHQTVGYRGLGFNKPTTNSAGFKADDCPTTAWGHTGFTGTCVWVDKKNDLIFVFLSNRVYPNAKTNRLNGLGIRKRMHQVFYDQILPRPVVLDSVAILDSIL